MKEIEYFRPKVTHKIFASLLDGMIFILLALISIVISKNIVNNTDTGQSKIRELDSIKLRSGLFAKDTDNQVRDIVTVLNLDESSSSSTVEKRLVKAIDDFFTYSEIINGVQFKNDMVSELNSLKLADDLTYTFNGSTYKLFVLENDEIVKNKPNGSPLPIREYVNFYKSYIDNYALGYFHSKNEKVITLEKWFSYMMMIEVIASIALSSIIVYYIIPLCFSRGKKTIGRFAFKYGLVNKNMLNVSWKLFTVRFLIIFFLEIMLSIVTLGVPIIFSFTMSLVTKKKQSFHDYMLGIEEVDTDDSTIYKNIEEISAPASNDDYQNFTLR